MPSVRNILLDLQHLPRNGCTLTENQIENKWWIKLDKLTVLKDTNLLSMSSVKATSSLLSKYISWAKRKSNTNIPDEEYYKEQDFVSMNSEIEIILIS